MIETLLRIKEAEQKVMVEREKLETELGLLRLTLQQSVADRQKEDGLSLATYREEQQTRAIEQFKGSKEKNQQRFATATSQLEGKSKNNQEQVVERIMKEVEKIYGRF